MATPAAAAAVGTDQNASHAAQLEIQLGAEIFHNIATSASEENVIISPLLLESALALLYLGSDGATAEELQRLLQLKQRFVSNAKMANYYATHLTTATAAASDTRILLQNKILLHETNSVADDFQKIAQTYFHITAEKLNLRAANCEKLKCQLNALLTKIGSTQSNFQLPTAEEASSVLLLLAANFQYKWFLPFSAYRSGLYDFHINAELQKSVPMLFDDDMFVKFAEFRELNARAIELPFEHDDELTMLLILPNQRDGLAQLANELRTQQLGVLQERMQMESVQVLLPKFSIDFECSLRQALKQIGYTQIFANNADFKHLLSEQTTKEKGCSGLPIAEVLHKVQVDVNESGSEVSNVPALKPIVISNSINGRQKFFRADHPFFFAIRGADVTYFLGHVVKF